jgi:hypothetical protein
MGSALGGRAATAGGNVGQALLTGGLGAARTIQAGAGTSVENDSSVIMTINHQSLTYFFNGNNWFII